MRFFPLLFLAAASTALATETAVIPTGTDVPSLQTAIAQVREEVAGAQRLIERAKTYPTNADSRHKKVVFALRKQRWEAVLHDLKSELAELSASTSSASAEYTTRATTSTHAAATSSAVEVTSSPRAATTSKAEQTTSARPTTTSASTTTVKTSSVAVSTTTTSAAAATSSAASSGSPKSKRAIGFNDVGALTNLDVDYVYQWNPWIPDGLPSGVSYMPMLWGPKFESVWDEAVEAALAAGSTILLGANEPDLNGKEEAAGMTIDALVTEWQTYMSPYKSRATLVGPAVTNGGDGMGLDYLQSFKDACPSCFEEMSMIALHWTYFKNAYKQFGIPIFISEFFCTGSETEQATFLKEVIPWMEEDAQSYIQLYSPEGGLVGVFVSDTSGTLTDLGKVYVSL
ncbi:hypothetical protein JCM10207_008245 [Rhodosporidiobolus poonsookiae]